MARNVVLTILLLSAPVFADGAHVIISLLLTGGPILGIFTPYWGIKCSGRFSSINVQLAVVGMAIVCGILGYVVVAKLLLTNEYIWVSGTGILIGPILLVSGLIAGRLPGFLMEVVAGKCFPNALTKNGVGFQE